TGLIRGTGTILDNYKFTTDGRDVVPFHFGEGACQSGPGCQRNMAGGPEAEVRKRAFNFSAGPSGNEAVSRSAFFGLQYAFSDRLSSYFEAFGGRTESNSRGSRSYEAQDLWTGSVAVDNAFLPEHVRQIMVDNGIERFQLSKLGSFDAPNDIGGTQEEINVFTLWQWGVGLDYRIPGVEWDLALSWQQGESKRNSQGIE